MKASASGSGDMSLAAAAAMMTKSRGRINLAILLLLSEELEKLNCDFDGNLSVFYRQNLPVSTRSVLKVS